MVTRGEGGFRVAEGGKWVKGIHCIAMDGN